MLRIVSSFTALALLLFGTTAIVAQMPATKMLWSTPIVPLTHALPSVESPFDGKQVFVPQDSGSISSLDTTTGELQWTYTGLNVTGQRINQISVIPTRAVIVWAVTGIVALNPKTGAVLWSTTDFQPNAMLATEHAVLLTMGGPSALMALSPLTGQMMYAYPIDTNINSLGVIKCGAAIVCWMQFADGGVNGQAVVFDLRAGKVLHATPLPVVSGIYLQHFHATDTHLIAVYDRYVKNQRLGIAITAVDLFRGGIVWSHSLPAAARSGSYPMSIGNGVVSLVIDLAGPGGLSPTLNLLAFDFHSIDGAVVLNSTMTYELNTPFPSFSEIHDSRVWMCQVWEGVRFALTMTTFDLVTGQTVGNFTAPIASPLPSLTMSVNVSGLAGPCWVIPNQVGMTVNSALTGVLVSAANTIPGILNAQATFDGKVILMTNTSVVALQP